MKPNIAKLSCEDVLQAFAIEQVQDRSILERYLREYPQYAIEITDLWREFSRPIEEPQVLSVEDQTAVEEAWRVYSSSTSAATLSLLSSLSVSKQRELAIYLEVPRQIIAAFRERKVIVSTIPRRFLKKLADGLNAPVDQVIAALSLPQMESLRSHKSDEKPVPVEPATFEQLLIEAQLSEAKRAELMAN